MNESLSTQQIAEVPNQSTDSPKSQKLAFICWKVSWLCGTGSWTQIISDPNDLWSKNFDVYLYEISCNCSSVLFINRKVRESVIQRERKNLGKRECWFKLFKLFCK
ncbi:hypothetical protein BS47DRAFT_1335445 [Hydnum rufescens UP504]|uniref:Uncharacterized protein n=1 Tax=Hydnum rufescens UP504 TaxID=1448309 RepID=A0A9P6BAG8_9AGAM|nr:hypothetical protein BS47DRAFT_1335445 [Hydnum rufescens UP504]